MLDENNLTDEQIEKFFESGGEELPEGLDEKTEEGDQKDVQVDKAQEQQPAERPADDVDIEALRQERDNYKNGMLSERTQRKEFQQELQRLKAVEDELKRLNENISQKSPQDPEIDFDEQPLEALKKKTEELLKRQSEYDARIQKQEEEAKLSAQFNEFAGEVKSKTKQFAETNPDYYDAYNYLVESRVNELKIYGMSDAKIKEALGQDEVSIALLAMESGKNPAEIVYNLSKHRGYISKAHEQISHASEKLDRIEKGSSLSKSLGGVGGNVAAELSLDSLDNMTQDEIANLVADEAAWQKLAGGM